MNEARAFDVAVSVKNFLPALALRAISDGAENCFKSIFEAIIAIASLLNSAIILFF